MFGVKRGVRALRNMPEKVKKVKKHEVEKSRKKCRGQPARAARGRICVLVA